MASNQFNPETHRPIQDLKEFKGIADRAMREAAGMPLYDMDDPERPFTPEYDASMIPDAAVSTDSPILLTGDTEIVSRTSPASTESLISQAERMAEKVRAAGKQATRAVQSAREDAYESLGGGVARFREQGHLPAGRREDARQSVARGRGGKLVTRVELNGRFIDVEQDDVLPHAAQIEQAKDSLVAGRGTPTSRLSRKKVR